MFLLSLNDANPLRSIIVDELEHVLSNYCPIVYVYLDYTDPATHDATAVLANLLKQLLQAFKSDLPKEVKRDFDTLRAKIACYKANSNDYIHTILRAVKYFTVVFFLFDAIDEWERDGARGELLKCIRALENGAANVKVLITSRPHISLENIFESLESIEVRTNVSDVKTYIRAKLHSRVNAAVEEEIVTQLTASADAT